MFSMWEKVSGAIMMAKRYPRENIPAGQAKSLQGYPLGKKNASRCREA